eukprot:7956844-Pyramimonas_sp.AAC.1
MDFKKIKDDSNIQYDDVLKWFKGQHPSRFCSTAANDSTISYGIAMPGDIIWTPPACIVTECAHQEMRGWGLRIPMMNKAGIGNACKSQCGARRL